jgi:ubiquinone/menaquinone biosynthesis C-methylase UbiE
VVTVDLPDADYQSKVAAESKKWGDHLKVEASQEWNAWLDHPLIAEHYNHRSLVEDLPWRKWVIKELAGPAERSLDLGCGSGSRSILFMKTEPQSFSKDLT